MIYFVEQRKQRTRLREYKRTFGFNSPKWISLKSARQTVHGSDGNGVAKVLVYRIPSPWSPLIEADWVLAIEVDFYFLSVDKFYLYSLSQNHNHLHSLLEVGKEHKKTFVYESWFWVWVNAN